MRLRPVLPEKKVISDGFLGLIHFFSVSSQSLYFGKD